MDMVYLTHKGLEKLKSELKHLLEVVHPEATADLAAAREHGDLSENAEYDAARENIAKITALIAELHLKLSNVHLIEEASLGTGEVRILSRITLENMANGSTVDYTIVDPLQADPSKRLISVKSPIGSGLLGKKVDDEVEIDIPSGIIKFKVVKIELARGI